MKIMLTLAILCGIMIVGCREASKVETAPWTETQIEQMENDGTKTVPIARWTF